MSSVPEHYSLYSTSANDDSVSMVTTKIPPNGKKGQVLTKASSRDYDVKWSTSSGSGGDCGCESMTVVDIIKIMEG